jgi:hypothetical protein
MLPQSLARAVAAVHETPARGQKEHSVGIAVDKAGGNTAGLNAMSSMMPVMGNVMGAGMVMDQMKKVKKRGGFS